MYVVKASLINEVNVVESYSTRLGEVKRKSVMGGWGERHLTLFSRNRQTNIATVVMPA